MMNMWRRVVSGTPAKASCRATPSPQSITYATFLRERSPAPMPDLARPRSGSTAGAKENELRPGLTRGQPDAASERNGASQKSASAESREVRHHEVEGL